MSKVLKTVLKASKAVNHITSSYVDDIIVDTTRVKSNQVTAHLEKCGLIAKPSEKVDEAAVLG